jgi:glutamate 5-kinase
MGVIPIVNENDTLAVTEIKFGDNDTLSAITAAMVHADYLFLMTDVDCLYDKNPRTNPDAKAIEVVEDIAALQADGIPPFISSSQKGILKTTQSPAQAQL